jgi:hypothetical protein
VLDLEVVCSMSKRSWRRLFTSRRAAWQSVTTNFNKTALDRFSDAVAHSTLTFGQTNASVNGTDKSSENRGTWKVR